MTESNVNEVAFWLRQHKLYEIDQRYTSSSRQNYFKESFPRVPLRQLTEPLTTTCKKGLSDCIIEIQSFWRRTPHALLSTGNQQYKGNLTERFRNSFTKTKQEIEYEPFQSKLELFQFRVTASYFMCHFTLQKDQVILKHLDCSISDAWIDPQDIVTREGPPSTDYRASSEEEFSCAMHSFCPAVCCGKATGRFMCKRCSHGLRWT